MNDEKNVYITNRRKGKKVILIGFGIIVSGIFFIMGNSPIGILLVVGGVITIVAGKFINWYNN